MHLERQIATGTASDMVSRSLCKRLAQGSRNVSVCTEEGQSGAVSSVRVWPSLHPRQIMYAHRRR